MQEREALQLRVGREIEEAALPYYRALFPQSPRIIEKDRSDRILHNPFYGVVNGVYLDYETYAAKVREGSLPARSIHGPMHAARVALWAGLLTVLCGRHTEGITPWLFELQMAAAFHDAGRQDEGTDEWERESEQLFADWLHRTPGARVEALDTLQCAGSIERKTLINADTLDIQRVMGDRGRFDATRLSLWDDERIPRQIKEQLVTETWTFIHLTETPALKRELEDSGALYFQLIRVLVEAHRTTSSYPVLYDLLEELAGYKD